MGWILALLGLAFIGASFILAKKQQQDYQRLQEEMMAAVVNAGVIELQTLKSDLAQELQNQYEQHVADLEAKVKELMLSLERTTAPVPRSIEQPAAQEAVNEGQEISAKPAFGVGLWQERERLIREMYKLGMNVEAIAKELNIGKGEVSLVLDLARHEGANG